MLSIEDWSNLADDLSKKGIAKGTKAFDDYIWETYNKPWLESAMQRGDDIILWSDPINSANGFYKQELEFVKLNASKYGYDYNRGIGEGIFLNN